MTNDIPIKKIKRIALVKFCFIFLGGMQCFKPRCVFMPFLLVPNA